MKATSILHYAFRARDPQRLGRFYAELFDGRCFLHPVMSGLGIVIVKIAHPDALFRGLLEFWPWEIEWDGAAAEFRRTASRPSDVSYGHLAVHVDLDADSVVAELRQRGIEVRLEPRGLGLSIPCIDDPEGNMVELFPRLDHLDLPAEAFCSSAELSHAMGAMHRRLEQAAAARGIDGRYPLLLFES